MKRKIVSDLMLTLLVISMLTLAFNIQRVKASGTIYIRADGSVDPSTAPIMRDGDVYTFTDNVYDSVVIERNNIKIDGAGYILQGAGALTQPYSYGFSLSNINNVTIEGTIIKDWNRGVSLDYSSDNNISGNHITSNYRGVYGEWSNVNRIFGNNILHNGYDGIALWWSDDVAISENKIIGNNNYGIAGSWASYITISGNNISNHSTGIILGNLSNSVIHGNTVMSGEHGVSLYYSSINNVISGNNITSSAYNGLGLQESCNNNTISGNRIANNGQQGISLQSSFYNTIYENTITNNSVAMSIASSSYNTIFGNTITNNEYGIELYHSSSNTLRNNSMVGNGYNFGVYGGMLSHFIQDIDVSNTVNGKPVYYWVNRQNQTVPLDAGYAALVNSTSITVKDLNLKNNLQGILLAYTTNSQITNNTITNNWDGIGLDFGSYDNTVSGNNIINNNVGVFLDGSSDNTVSGNKITNNEYGIGLDGSSNNTLHGNNITNNSGYGIGLYYSSNNKIYHNNFISNTIQAAPDEPYSNIWDDDYPSGGNYWSDYAGVDEKSGTNQDEPTSDGIGDTPYIIDGANQDNYPLMDPWVERKVGVKAGDWAEYSYDFSWNSTDPNEQPPPGIEDLDLLTITVLDVYDTTITFQQTIRLKNGTETGYTWVVDVETGLGNGTYQLDFISADLNAGDRLNAPYPGLPIWCGWHIEETVLRTYVGVERETNHLNVTNWSEFLPTPPPSPPHTITTSTDDFYWDRTTGILSENAHEENRERGSYTTSFSFKIKMVDTNLWVAPIPTTIDELKTEIEELGSEGEIDNQGIIKSLLAKLNVAQKLVDKEKVDEAEMVLNGFIVQVQKLSGIHIPVGVADILIQSAEHIISEL